MTLVAAAVMAVQLDSGIREDFWTLLASARYGWSDHEAAAFVVMTPDGVRLVPWPRSIDAHGARWRGAFPRGTIAIAHTHPNRDTDPSRIDRRTAKRLRLPVYVITHSRITVTDGAATYTIARGRWRI